MSDFSELCPLFETGVFSEVTFAELNMSAVQAGYDHCMSILQTGKG